MKTINHKITIDLVSETKAAEQLIQIGWKIKEIVIREQTKNVILKLEKEEYINE